MSPKEIHEARIIRDAEKAEPGIVRRTLDDARRISAGIVLQPGLGKGPTKSDER